jgi:acetyl/propionyl-CoA carboxylase alpha subunit
MLISTVNDKKYSVEFKDNSHTEGVINGKPFKVDIALNNQYLHLIRDNKSYKVFILKADYENKRVSLKINSKIVTVDLNDEIDLLLNSMGTFDKQQKKDDYLKAPMPGLINKILIKKGDAVKKGDTLMVLEAMKMENNLKAPHDAVIKDITVNIFKPVEKNEILAVFE